MWGRTQLCREKSVQEKTEEGTHQLHADFEFLEQLSTMTWVPVPEGLS